MVLEGVIRHTSRPRNDVVHKSNGGGGISRGSISQGGFLAVCSYQEYFRTASGGRGRGGQAVMLTSVGAGCQ